MLADRRPVTRERQRGERQQDDESAAPAEAGQRQGRDVSGAQAADNRVDGPEQRGQGQQKIRLIEQSPVLAAARIGVCFRHECASPCRSRRRSVDLSGKELSWTAVKDQCRRCMVPSRFCRSATQQSRHRRRLFGHGLSRKFLLIQQLNARRAGFTRALSPCLAGHHPLFERVEAVMPRRFSRHMNVRGFVHPSLQFLGTFLHGQCCRGRLPMGRRGQRQDC